ncbi:MAG: hypothetical protein HY233_10930 [Acidobacteriales bacterium]|nr:hypothetical protein [Terriglobales bacterium]
MSRKKRAAWRPDYDPLFYRQLSCRARRIFLFRDEYIFDVEKAVVVETPAVGPRHLRIRKAKEHGGLPGAVHQDDEG